MEEQKIQEIGNAELWLGMELNEKIDNIEIASHQVSDKEETSKIEKHKNMIKNLKNEDLQEIEEQQ